MGFTKPRIVRVINGPGFHLSYKPSDAGYCSNTTAIVLGDQECFLILNGNHLGVLYDKSLEECVNYFFDNVRLVNRSSEHDTSCFNKFRHLLGEN